MLMSSYGTLEKVCDEKIEFGVKIMLLQKTLNLSS